MMTELGQATVFRYQKGGGEQREQDGAEKRVEEAIKERLPDN